MAKGIYAMALAYGRERQGTVDIETFEAGAYAVLDEIESLAYSDHTESDRMLLIKDYIRKQKSERYGDKVRQC